MDSFMEDSKTNVYLDKQQEREAFERLRNGDESAKEEIYLSIKGYVVQFASRFFGSRLPLEDLVQAGNLGVLKAMDKFDANRGVRFHSYAKWWIRSEMQFASMSGGYSLSLPHRSWVDCMACLRAETKIMEERGNDMFSRPTEEEIAERSGQSLALAKASMIMRYGVTRLDEERSASTVNDKDTDGYTYMDYLGLGNEQEGINHLCDQDIKDAAQGILNKMPDRTREIVSKNFGIGVDEPMRLSDIAEEINLSRERVRQIKTEALDRVAVSIRYKELRDVAREAIN